MPVNEAQGFSASNLTESQQKQQMEAIYGMSPPTTAELTYEQRVTLRQALDLLDAKQAKIGQFDLANPPVPRYVHQEFPFLMYRRTLRKVEGEKKYIIEAEKAHNPAQRQAMTAAGWSADPIPPEPPESDLTAEEEAEEINQKLKRRQPK